MPVDYPQAQWVGTDGINFTVGREGNKIGAIVIHTEVGSEAGTIQWFKNPASRASAHYSIGLDGSVHQYVREEDTAWHAGDWYENLRTIGIEREDGGQTFKPMSNAQSQSWQDLVWYLIKKYQIPLRWASRGGTGIIPHHLINPLHSGCPGSAVEYVAGLMIARGAPWQAPIIKPKRNHAVDLTNKNGVTWLAVRGPAGKDGKHHPYAGPTGRVAIDLDHDGDCTHVSIAYNQVKELLEVVAVGNKGELFQYLITGDYPNVTVHGPTLIQGMAAVD